MCKIDRKKIFYSITTIGFYASFLQKCPLMKLFSFYRDLEEDPLFGDDLSPDSRLSGSDWLSSSPPLSPGNSKSDGKTEVHKIVNRWTVCLLHNTLRSFAQPVSFLKFCQILTPAVSCVWCPMRPSHHIMLKAQAMTPTSEMHTDR